MMRFLLLSLICLAVGGGCVLREFTIRSEPSGAEIFIDGKQLNKTPFTQRFDFYGTHRVVLRYKGYLTYEGEIRLKIPWWQYFPFDLFTEILPFEIKDSQDFSFTLKKAEEIPQDLKKKAEEMNREWRSDER